MSLGPYVVKPNEQKSSGGWVKAGYLSLTKSKKAIKIKINDTYYVVPISQLRQVLQEEKDFCNVSKAEK